MPNLIWNEGEYAEDGSVTVEPHTHSLINLAEYEARLNAYKNHDHDSGEPRPDKPTESGLWMIKQGGSHVLMNLAVVLTNKPESLGLTRGQHDSAISYKTLPEVEALAIKWSNQKRSKLALNVLY